MGNFYIFEADRPVIEQVGDVSIHKLKEVKLTLGSTLEPLREVISEVHKKGGSLVLDFSNVKWMDSSALGAIVGAHVKFEGALGIFGANKNIKDTFQVTKLYTVLNIYGSREETLEKTPSRAVRGNGGAPVVVEAAVSQL